MPSGAKARLKPNATYFTVLDSLDDLIRGNAYPISGLFEGYAFADKAVSPLKRLAEGYILRGQSQ